VLTDFVYAGGTMNFHLGTFAAGHPSHANTRFPGFFMYASYFPASLKEGQRFAWGWPWQPARPCARNALVCARTVATHKGGARGPNAGRGRGANRRRARRTALSAGG